MSSNLEHNSAVDYAIRKSSQRENYFVIELIVSCNNLPDYSSMERASTFAVISVDINSLDDHDKIVIGGVQEEEADRYEDEGDVSVESIRTEDYVSDWVVKRITEVQADETNPIYQQTFSFSSQNQAVMRFKVAIYQRKKKLMDFGAIEDGELVGEAEFLIGDMIKRKKEGLEKPLVNYERRSTNNKLKALRTTCTLRYEQIEQTNTLLTL